MITKCSIYKHLINYRPSAASKAIRSRSFQLKVFSWYFLPVKRVDYLQNFEVIKYLIIIAVSNSYVCSVFKLINEAVLFILNTGRNLGDDPQDFPETYIHKLARSNRHLHNNQLVKPGFYDEALPSSGSVRNHNATC